MPVAMRAGLSELGISNWLPHANTKWVSRFGRRKFNQIVARMAEHYHGETPYVQLVLDYVLAKSPDGHIFWALRQRCLPGSVAYIPTDCAGARFGSPYITRHDMIYDGTWTTYGRAEAEFRNDSPHYYTCPAKFLLLSPVVNPHWRNQLRAFQKLPAKVRKELLP